MCVCVCACACADMWEKHWVGKGRALVYCAPSAWDPDLHDGFFIDDLIGRQARLAKGVVLEVPFARLVVIAGSRGDCRFHHFGGEGLLSLLDLFVAECAAFA